MKTDKAQITDYLNVDKTEIITGLDNGMTVEQHLNTYNPTAMFEGLDYSSTLRRMKEILDLLQDGGFDLNILVYNNLRIIMCCDWIPVSARFFLLRSICLMQDGTSVMKLMNGVPIKMRMTSNQPKLMDVMKSTLYIKNEEEYYRMWMMRINKATRENIEEIIQKIERHEDEGEFLKKLEGTKCRMETGDIVIC